MDMESGTAAVTGISKTKLVYKTAEVAVHNVLFGFVFADGWTEVQGAPQLSLLTASVSF